MTDTSARFHLPHILPGQAQKELFHNEAISLIDALLHPAVETAAIAVPTSPEPGQCWIIAPNAEGVWSGRSGELACWTAGGWRFAAPTIGLRVWNKAEARDVQWDGTSWQAIVRTGAIAIGGAQVLGPRRPAIPSPSGGTVIDVQARAAVAAIIATFMSHGLTD